MDKIPCPFEGCHRDVVGVESFKADRSWEREASGKLKMTMPEPRLRYRVTYSESHASFVEELPDELRKAIEGARRS
jgi:hypothetical protein